MIKTAFTCIVLLLASGWTLSDIPGTFSWVTVLLIPNTLLVLLLIVLLKIIWDAVRGGKPPDE